MYISLILKMINGFSWPAKIMAIPSENNLITRFHHCPPSVNANQSANGAKVHALQFKEKHYQMQCIVTGA